MTEEKDALAACAVQARSWFLEQAAPFWSDIGRRPVGLFAERLTHDRIPDEAYYRIFVQARQIYAMWAAGTLGWTGPWRTLIKETMTTLLQKARRSDGFFVHKLDRDGNVLDARADLYDQAFVLFALAISGRALQDEQYFDKAAHLMETLETWRHESGGFREGEIASADIRRQNPHMHLLEAFWTLYEASGQERFKQAALEIAVLCKNKFIHRESGALLEYFADDWSQLRSPLGSTVEPGHCFEWAWLYEKLEAEGVAGSKAVSDGLVGFARAHGIDQRRGVAINEIDIEGRSLDDKARLWPQTERLKAGIIRLQRTGVAADKAEVLSAWAGLAHYFHKPDQVLWHDKLQQDGTFLTELVPASSLYHIACAIKELWTYAGLSR